ncbi:type II toxin-antitoxin system VapC family toxin [Halomonas sp. MMSF_3323]|uniref:type II toxin-antitoxin system VapC family toxin n=1 Tax=Halomonas sp. MMSF_3323 TaxID=3046701 RepID=UPI00274026D6|nr:PIN domain-containing protein [Halomonas sp. MMSF_3323]
MRVVIDTNILVQFMRDPDPVDLKDPENGDIVSRAAARASALVDLIDQRNGLVVIPAPVLAEYLIGIKQDAYQKQLNLLNSFSCIEISPFDQISAIECALLVDESEHKALDPKATKAKLRVDRQILATAISVGAEELWTHDIGLYKKAKAIGLVTKSLACIEPNPDQQDLALSDTQDDQP